MSSASASTDAIRLSDDDVQAIDRLRDTYNKLKAELGKVIVGQQGVIEQLVICMFARRHALLMGVPGLAKTLLVSKLAETMSLKFFSHSVHSGLDAHGYHRNGHPSRETPVASENFNSSLGQSSPTSS